MGIKSWIINKLEKDVELSAGHIELENLTEEDREELFKQFGEGDVNLTEFLRQSYKNEKMYPSRKPLIFDLKKRLLSYLKGTKQIEETTTVSSIQKIKKNSWELSDKEKSAIKEHQEFSNINKNGKKLYEESIILIGPSGAGKSTVAEELRKKTGMQRLCLDTIANRARDTGVMRNFKNADEFFSYMLSETLERVKKDGSYGIVDFGAGHSVYDDQEIFERVKSMLKPFKNIVLLLPDKDEEKSLDIMKSRATGDTRDNKKFFESPCNKELATMIVYGNNRQPLEIAEEIMQCIKKRKEQQIEI